MKPFILSFLLLVSCLSQAQISVINRSLTDSSLNYLYTWIDNAIEVYGVGKDARLVIVGGSGSIISLGNGRFVIQVASVTDSCELIVSKNGKTLFKKNYKVREPGNIIATVASRKDTTMRMPLIVANPFVLVTIPGCYWRHNFRVVYFQTGFVQNDDSTVLETFGNQFSNEQIQAIRALKSGDVIHFDEIYALGPDSKRQHLPSFWIRIE